MLKAKLVGKRTVAKHLADFGEDALRPASRAGVVAGCQIVAKAAKKAVPDDTGSYRKSIGHKVKMRRDGTGVYGVVGPRRDSKKDKKAGKIKYRRKVGLRKRAGGLPSVVKYADPVKYAHLVEYGRRAVTVKKKTLLSDGSVIFGKTVKAVQGKAPMRKAWDASSAACQTVMRQKYAEAVRRGGRR